MKAIVSILSICFFFLAPLAFGQGDATPSSTRACEQCDPNPSFNKCDITTSCIRTKPNGQLHCACRAGYKAAAPDNASTEHYRTLFAGQEYRVFVRPGVKCDTLCKDYWLGPQGCKEITVRPECS